MRHRSWNRAVRIRVKAGICVVGIAVLVIFVVGKLLSGLSCEDATEESEMPSLPVPLVETLENVWILEEDEDGISLFRDGEREKYDYGMEYCPAESVREQVADVVLTDGEVTDIALKKDKINGKVLGADETGIVIEGYGKLPMSESCKGYRLYKTLEMCTWEDICFGYDFTDFCVENGEICAILAVKEEAMEYIRVLLKNSDYQGIFHEEPTVTADTAFTVVYGAADDLKRESHAAGEELTFDSESSYFEDDRIWIVPEVLTGKVQVTNLKRSQGTPSYRGQLELIRTNEGVVVVNEVSLEDYLYSVVPSEMPSGYPKEALKAQAVCARTYAYAHMEKAGYPLYGAHVDDSTSYQVYNNVKEQESTTTAVKETYGELLLTAEGETAETFYYSTSCGVGSDANVWKTEAAGQIDYLSAKALNRKTMALLFAASDGQTDSDRKTEDGQEMSGTENQEDIAALLQNETAFREFITSKDPDDFEYEESWYRWTYEVEKLDTEHMLEVLKKRYAANNSLVLTWEKSAYVSKEIGKLDEITDIYIEKRGAGGVADELVIETKSERYKVISEHNIRYVLNDGASSVIRQDGSETASPNLLPSGFFVITTSQKDGNVVGYSLIGGGYGHGVGMSQNGARRMAQSGYTSEDILNFFYEGCFVEAIYGGEPQ